MKNKTVVVGISGGVDSAVAAYLLKKQGYNVIGLFMTNWQEKDHNNNCTSEQDFSDVKNICGQLDIKYYHVDFSKEYKELVFMHFIDEYKKGRTPNPDVLCNSEIKFEVFAKYAFSIGADYIATGHYAKIDIFNGEKNLFRCKDENKDQTYFLNQLNKTQIDKVLFPLSEMQKDEVRKIAKENNLIVYNKKDSTGICFIGERDFRKFLSDYIPTKKGEIRDLSERVLGYHNGVFYYTLGQRKGLGIGGGTGVDNQPWYVAKKDVINNILYVAQGEAKELYSYKIKVEKFNFINYIPQDEEFRATVRVRHRQKLVPCSVSKVKDALNISLDIPIKGVTEGQYAVLYIDKLCLGGGVIENKHF